MATVDARQGTDVFGAEIYLKIWNWDKKANLWTLNTRVDRPHGAQRVTSLAFRPSGKDRIVESLVSTGEDGTVKVWGTRTAQSKSEQSEGTSSCSSPVTRLLTASQSSGSPAQPQGFVPRYRRMPRGHWMARYWPLHLGHTSCSTILVACSW